MIKAVSYPMVLGTGAQRKIMVTPESGGFFFFLKHADLFGLEKMKRL